jgi:hypothetical protein
VSKGRAGSHSPYLSTDLQMRPDHRFVERFHPPLGDHLPAVQNGVGVADLAREADLLLDQQDAEALLAVELGHHAADQAVGWAEVRGPTRGLP